MKKLIIMLTFSVFGLTMLTGEYNTAGAQTSTQKKKKWSSRKKGALYGAAAGAATGIIISKKDKKGALIGAAAGAGTGYLIGRQRDKKKGRLPRN
jgi:hypothetical protein